MEPYLKRRTSHDSARRGEVGRVTRFCTFIFTKGLRAQSYDLDCIHLAVNLRFVDSHV